MRPAARSAPWAALALTLALAAPALAAAVEHTDPADDVFRDLSTPVDEPRVDILLVRANRTGDVLDLRMELNGTLPVAGNVAAGADRTYRYLFPVIFDHEEGQSLIQDHDLSVLCKVREGHDLRNCTVPQEEYFLRVLSIRPDAAGFNISLKLTSSTPHGRLEVGGAATMTTENGTEVQAQDFTANALPYGQQPDTSTQAGEAGATAPDPPWWKTPWILLVAAIVGIAGAVLWNRYGRA